MLFRLFTLSQFTLLANGLYGWVVLGHTNVITINGQELKDIDKFKYVGGTENNTADMKTD